MPATSATVSLGEGATGYIWWLDLLLLGVCCWYTVTFLQQCSDKPTINLIRHVVKGLC
ncbi:hypothetical protein [Desulfosporosinus acididurans]|uniref:hypothetical protein n=1 Tax=Desulfosporosinus acididurans TaxID=476652 RepID=UPI00137916ED|nr:hypothetical protein [Desulfosporosinus acididurans]